MYFEITRKEIFLVVSLATIITSFSGWIFGCWKCRYKSAIIHQRSHNPVDKSYQVNIPLLCYRVQSDLFNDKQYASSGRLEPENSLKLVEQLKFCLSDWFCKFISKLQILVSFRLSDIQDSSCFFGHFDNFVLLFVDDPLSAFIISTIEACKGMVMDASSAVPYFLFNPSIRACICMNLTCR